MFQVMGNLWSRWTEFVWSSTLMKNNRKYTACDSPECVRCHRYQQVREEAWGKLQRYADKHTWQGLTAILLAIGEGKRYRDVRARLGRDRASLMPLPLQNPNVLFLPTVRKIPWWESIGDASNNPFTEETKTLELNYNVILEEFEAVFKDVVNVSPNEGTETEGQAPIKHWMVNRTEKGCWCVYHLYNQGQKAAENCDRCPQTTKLVEGLASVMTGSLFGNVSFSVLYPETHIEEHYGPTNARIRCHLGLKVPEGCKLKVAGEERAWTEGKTLLFDDSFLHSATNSHPTDHRAVLLVDLWSPDLSSQAREGLINIF